MVGEGIWSERFQDIRKYERYLARVLRDAFGCSEVPIKLMFRRRDKIVLAPKGD